MRTCRGLSESVEAYSRVNKVYVCIYGITKRRVKNRKVIWQSYDFGELSLGHAHFCRRPRPISPDEFFEITCEGYLILTLERVVVYFTFSRQILKSDETVTFLFPLIISLHFTEKNCE